MQIVQLYDPDRRPANWTEIIRPHQFAAFATLLDTNTPCDAAGLPVRVADQYSCLLFDSLAEAEAFCRRVVLDSPAARFDVFDSAGRAMPPLLTVVHPSRVDTLDGNAGSARRNTLGAIALVVVAPILFWIDWRRDGLLILPTILGINLLMIAARLIQLNSAHSSAARSRRERMQHHDDTRQS